MNNKEISLYREEKVKRKLPINLTQKDMMDVSVLVCTHNSILNIEKNLHCLSKQKYSPSLNWEVIIADYESDDGTLAFLENIDTKSLVPNLSVINVKDPGKTPAIEAGFYASKGEAICIVDDDNMVDINYIQTAFDLINDKGDIGVIGAFGVASLPEGIRTPNWFEFFKGRYAVGNQFHKQGYLDGAGYAFWGAGSVFRKSAWLKAKQIGFIPALNPSRGKSRDVFLDGFSGGEDPEMCFAILMAGYKLWYEPSLIYEHHIPASRISTKFLLNTSKGVSVAAPYLRVFLSFVIKEDSLSNKLKVIIWQNYFLHLIYILISYFKQLFKVLLDRNFCYLRLRVLLTSFLSEIRGVRIISNKYQELCIKFKTMKDNFKEL